MKKYYIWYDNGTGYYDMAGTVEAESKTAAIDAAISLFGFAQARTLALATRANPNQRKPTGSAHPDHARHARESAARTRKQRTAALSTVGLTNASVSRVLADAFEQESTTVRLVTPLPCVVRGCENKAYVAQGWPVQDEATLGLWVIQPICESCTLRMQALYEDSE